MVSAIICYMHGDRETQPPVEPTLPAPDPGGPVGEITDVLRADTRTPCRRSEQAGGRQRPADRGARRGPGADRRRYPPGNVGLLAAEVAAEALLAEARDEAEEMMAAARATVKAFRSQAEELVQAAEREIDSRPADQVDERAEQRAELPASRPPNRTGPLPGPSRSWPTPTGWPPAGWPRPAPRPTRRSDPPVAGPSRSRPASRRTGWPAPKKPGQSFSMLGTRPPASLPRPTSR